MGTRADFYIGKGEKAQWLGAIAWDGYPEGIDDSLFEAKTEDDFKERLQEFFAERDDVSLPETGWPWPWDTSDTTDFAYAFDDGKVSASCFGGNWFDPTVEQTDDSVESGEEAIFPDMKEFKNVAMDNRSGLIIVSG